MSLCSLRNSFVPSAVGYIAFEATYQSVQIRENGTSIHTFYLNRKSKIEIRKLTWHHEFYCFRQQPVAGGFTNEHKDKGESG